jgi:Ca2+:H+ antiporter
MAEQLSLLCGMFSGWINVLLIFIPIGQICKYLECDSIIVFSTNFMAIIPLASLLGGATEALSAHVGQLIGGLLNATFGNAVEMIMCIQSVRLDLMDVVKGNLLGSILSNLLLVLGMALVASGFKRKTATFNAQGAAANMTCQLVASISVCLPTVYHTVHGANDEEVLHISRICSLLLMGLYGLFMFFMLGTHADLFVDGGEEEEAESVLGPGFSLLLLFVITLLVERSSDALVDVIGDVSEDYGISKAFIGVILLPIVGNAAEHATAVTCAYNGMIDLALGVAVGSSTQIALFVVPVAVVFGWISGQEMDLNFSIFDTVCQMLTVFLVSQILQHGSTNWLHGAMLMSVYLFIAIETLYIPDPVHV